MKNYAIKQQNYAEQAKRLKIALKYEFYVEALSIEYAVIEDRLQSILVHSGFSVFDKDGNLYGIKKNINRIKSCAFFCDKRVRKLVPLELLDEIHDWKEKRNGVIHALLKREFGHGEIKEIAMQGDDLKRRIDNASKRINTFTAKLSESTKPRG